MTFNNWWAKQTESFDPEEIGLMQLARITWEAATLDERERCKEDMSVLFDGHAVLQELGEKEKHFVSPEAVSGVLDAVVRLIKRNQK